MERLILWCCVIRVKYFSEVCVILFGLGVFFLVMEFDVLVGGLEVFDVGFVLGLLF